MKLPYAKESGYLLSPLWEYFKLWTLPVPMTDEINHIVRLYNINLEDGKEENRSAQ